MNSSRVLVRVAGADDWRGDDLRFVIGSGDAMQRRKELTDGYKHIVDVRIDFSEDMPTHTYENGHLKRLETT